MRTPHLTLLSIKLGVRLGKEGCAVPPNDLGLHLQLVQPVKLVQLVKLTPRDTRWGILRCEIWSALVAPPHYSLTSVYQTS